MAEYTGGYTSAINDQSRRAIADQEVQAMIQALAINEQKMAQQKAAQEKAQAAQLNAVRTFPMMGAPQGGPQPPAPGQPSVPMMPPGGAPPMSPPQAPTMGAQALSATQAPPPPMGWSASPSASPALGGTPPMPPGGGAPGGMPAPMSAPGGGQPAILPAGLTSATQAIEAMKRAKVPEEQQYATLEAMLPMMDAENKRIVDTMRIDMLSKQAGVRAAAEERRRLEAAKDKPTAAIKNALFATGGDEGAARAAVGKQVTKAGIPPKYAGGASGGGGGVKGASGPLGGPIEKDVVDYYATQSLAGDNSWQVGLARGKEGQKLIQAVKDRIPKMAAEYGISPEEAIANKGELVGKMKAISQRQLYVSAGNQFARNMQTQADLVEKYMKPGASGAPPALNKWIQAGRKQIAGDPDVTALDVAIRGLAREHQRIVTGVTSNAQLHVAAQETADKMLNIDQTPDQMRASLKVMREEAENAIAAGKAEIESLKGDIKTKKMGTTGAATKGPQPGTVEKGYRFKGGDPAKKENWEKV